MLTPDQRIARIASRQHSVFSRAQALRCGFTEDEIDGRLGRGLWEKVHRAVYRIAAAPPTYEGHAMAAMLAAGDRAAISHTTAAGLFHVEGVTRGPIHLTVPRGKRCLIPGVSVHESTNLIDKDVTFIGRIRVTSPIRTMIDLARLVPEDVLEDAMDDLLRRGKISVEGVLKRLELMDPRSVRGARKLKQLLTVRAGKRTSLSGRQNKMRRILEAAGITGLEHEYRVHDEHGRFVAQADLAIPAAKLAIEFDSFTWHSSPRAVARDRERRHRLTVAGWPPLEVTEELLNAPAELVARVVARLHRPSGG